jgi:hypothetical protein
MYSGHPLYPDQWSEWSEGNEPGHRRVLMSFGPMHLQPGDIKEFSFAFSFFNRDIYNWEQSIDQVYNNYSDDISFLFNAPVFPSTTGCQLDPFPVSPTPLNDLTLSPNPANQNVRVRFKSIPFATSFEVYNAYGGLVFQKENMPNLGQFDVSDWAAGVYYVLVKADHEVHFGTLVVHR